PSSAATGDQEALMAPKSGRSRWCHDRLGEGPRALPLAEEGAEHSAQKILTRLRGDHAAGGSDSRVDHPVALAGVGASLALLLRASAFRRAFGRRHLASLALDLALLLSRRHLVEPARRRRRYAGCGRGLRRRLGRGRLRRGDPARDDLVGALPVDRLAVLRP